MDRFMAFENHVDNIHRKIMRTVIYLSHIKNRIPDQTETTVIQTLIHSIINHYSNIWGTTSKGQILKIRKLQNFVIKSNTW